MRSKFKMKRCSTAKPPEDDWYLCTQTVAALTCRARCTGGSPPSSERAASSHNRNQSPLRQKRNSLHPWIHQRSTSRHYYFITYMVARACVILLPYFSDSSIKNKRESKIIPEIETKQKIRPPQAAASIQPRYAWMMGNIYVHTPSFFQTRKAQWSHTASLSEHQTVTVRFSRKDSCLE